ncbi:LysM peptidoglycan-binding domain-containing protein [Kitasatospora sp. NPDC057015]|uniref:LysM peptidoglycan-binding domain-containing protein n=1 Tax=Kitasatospora sp. NPDC057015 TaxID=3346001 RepID=UPI0036435B2F
MAAPRARNHARNDRQAPPGRRPVPGPPRRRRGGAGAVFGALAALLTLLVLLAGVPALLLYGTAAVAGMGDLAPGGLGQALTSPDDGRLFLWALVAIGWLAWACFALSVLLEIPAQLRGRIARRIPAFGWSQRIAAGLVGSVIALLPVAGSAFAATPDRTQAAVSAPQLAAGPQYAALPAGAPAPALAPAAEQQPGYTVRDSRPADSLWSIAERQLGSGSRWTEIAKLNDGRVMDDSGIRFDADRPIQPGWKLLMPADAKPDTTPAATPAPPAPAGPVAESGPTAGRHAKVTVAEGDTLSAIAERELGSAEAWPQLYEANKGVQAPDGERLTDPDEVVPGMVLAVPGVPDPAPAPAPAEAPAPQSAPAPEPPAPASPAPAASAPATEAPASPAPASPAAGAPSAPTTPAPAQAPPAGADAGQADAKKADGPSDDYTVALAASTVSVLLAAIMVGTVARRRGGQQRARKPRHRVALPAPPAAAFEAELRARQDASGLDVLNRALRTMARNTVRSGKRLPALVAARVTPGRTVELHLSGPATPIAPFRAAHAANVWWCPEDAGDLLSPGQAAKTAAPYPALVTLGTSPDGSVVLADLETVRLLHLSGHPDDARDVLRTLALELAHSPLADRLHLHLVDLAEELPISGPSAERVHRHPTLEAALAALGPRTAKARATLVAADAASPRDARSRGAADESWIPEIVLCAQQPGGEVPAELGRLLDARPRTCVAVITRAPERGTGPVARWTLPSTGQTTLPGLHLGLELQRLTGRQYENVAELLRSSCDETQHPAPAWTIDGPGIDLEPTELPAPVPVLVAVGAGSGSGDAEAGPRLLARVIGTGASPFAGTDPAAPLGAGPAGPAAPPAGPGQAFLAATSTGPFPSGQGGRAGINGRGRQASSTGTPAGGTPLNAAPPAGAPHTTGPAATGPAGIAPAGTAPAGTAPANGTPANGTPVPTQGVGPVPPPVGPRFEKTPPVQPVHPVQQGPSGAVPPAPVPPGPASEAAAPAAVAVPVVEPAPTHDQVPAPAASEPHTPARPAPADRPAAGHAVPVPDAAPVARTAAVRSDADDLLAILRSPEAHATRTAPRIRLLGPADVLGAAGPAEPAALLRLTELAAYLALRPGAEHTALDHDLHPGAAHLDPHPAGSHGDHPATPLPAKLADLAAWFGSSPDGRAFLRTDTEEGYAFAPTVTCDWDEFRSLYRRGMRSTSATADAALAHALALVRGAPFAEAPPAAFGWAEAERQDMIAAIVDTAHELAARRLQYGDHRSAEAAVFRGLAVAPDVELLHRDLFYAYASAGARDQLVRAVNRLDALSRRTGRELDADTVALLRDLLSG